MNGPTARHGLHGLAGAVLGVTIILASLASAAAQAVGGLAGPVPVGAQVVQSTPTTVLAALPGTGTIVANPYGAMFIQGASVSGNTISNLQPNVTIQLGTTAGTADSYAKIDFQGFNWGPGTVLTIRSGAAGQKLVLYNALAGASSISGTLLAQGGNGAAPPAIYLWNPSGFAIGLGGTITAPSGLTLDALGDTWTTGQDIVNAGSIDGGSSLILHGANINGSGAFKGNSTVVATFGSANNAVNGAHFLANGLQLFPSTGSDVLLTLNDYGNAPQYINVKVNGNARLSMPSAWPNGSTSPPNNPPVPPGGVRPAGVPDPTYGAGSSIIQATGSMTLDKGTSNDFVFPGGIVLKSGGTLDLNGVIVDQGWTTNGQAFQGTYFEAPNVVSSAGNIQVLTNDRNWVNFSTMPHAPVRTWTLARAADGSAQYVPADSAAPHLNTYSTLIEAAAAGQCWVCLVNSLPLDTQAPLVSITSPAAGSTLSGVVSLNASASDNIGVARVDFLANGTKLGSSTTTPYTFSWDTTRVSDGSVIISASAYDAAGNSTTASINANISNAPAPVSSQPTLTVTSSNPATGVPVRVYPADLSGNGDGSASFTRTYNANARVWISAALRAGSNYFVKWQKDGVDYSTASTTSVLADTNHTLTAVYETPSCSGVAVYPGIDSLKNAVAAYPAGTTYCIKAGIHRMNSQVLARTNDKYIGESGAILNGSKVLTSFVQSGSYWVATGQTQQEPPFAAVGSDGWPVCLAGAPACIYPEMVFLDGQDLWQVTSLADLAPGRFYFDYASDLIYLADNPTGHLVEATTGSGGIVGNTDGGSDSVTVKNLVFEKFGGGEVSLYAHNALKAVAGWRMENNEFRLISFIAVANFGNGVVRNNYIHHNGRAGIVGNGTIEGNVVSYNNTHGWQPGTDAGPMKFHGTSGLVLRGNIVANNTGEGIWVDFDNINVTYENNVVENNSLTGILHEVGCAAVIRYNVLRGNNSANAGQQLSHGAQIYARTSKDLDIYGNDVTAMAPGVHGIGIWGDYLSSGQPQTYTGTNCGTILMQNIQVHDNVVRLDVGQLSGNPWGASYSSVYFSNNTYFLKDLTGSHFHYNGGPWAKDPYQAAGGDVTGKFYQW